MPQPTNDASRSRIADVMLIFFWLTLRPVERFLTQCISVSTEPTVFVRECIRLGDTTNFLRAAGFFVSAISTTFLAEVATLYLLGIGNLAEPYYWLFILLTSIPFVLVCFLLVRLVAPLSFKDVLHLSFHPIGAGVFVGAAFALVASAVVALLVAFGSIPPIKYDLVQWQLGNEEQGVAVLRRVLYDCLKEDSLLFTVFSAGFQEPYTRLRPPIDDISWLRPVIVVLYLIIAACVFLAAVDRRKSIVFATVVAAALVATGATYLSLRTYFNWNFENSNCNQNLAERGLQRAEESALKEFARGLAGADQSELWDASIRAEGRTLVFTHRFKIPMVNMDAFHRGAALEQKAKLDMYCSNDFLKVIKPLLTETIYSSEGERLTSFSIGPADCPQW